MEEHRFFGKKEIEKYLDEVFEHAIPMSDRRIVRALRFVGTDNPDSPMLQNLDTLFSKGRYSAITEYTIEIWDDPDFLKAVNDIRIIDKLSAARRRKLKYLRALLETAGPLFHLKPFDFDGSPFRLIEGEFSIKNDSLMEAIAFYPYRHLAFMLLSTLIKTYWDDRKFINTIALNQMAQVQESVKYELDKDESALKKRLQFASRTLSDIDNHMEIGKRMGLTKWGQFIYDAIDGFVCVRYCYNQVDAAKEFDKWLKKNWNGWEDDNSKQIEEMRTAFCSICEKHNVATYNCDNAINYIALDLLHLPLAPYNPEEDDDMAFDPDDPDFGD